MHESIFKFPVIILVSKLLENNPKYIYKKKSLQVLVHLEKVLFLTTPKQIALYRNESINKKL
jgi:hypothetical protein